MQGVSLIINHNNNDNNNNNSNNNNKSNDNNHLFGFHVQSTKALLLPNYTIKKKKMYFIKI